ncbi:MAG: hypothetical protein IH587_09405 [Anaerolineae bacterium]|nr:hypothetical protein [Anaerolineae bacterium]
MWRFSIFIWLIVIVLVGCAPTSVMDAPAAQIPFPTMTPGHYAAGEMPTQVALALDGGLALNAASALNPNQATAAPSFNRCPPAASPELDPQPSIAREMDASMIRFLDAGGDAPTLEEALRSQWGVLGSSGFVRTDIDFSGEGTPEFIISYLAPDGGGSLLIASCADGRVLQVYETTLGGEPPQILWANDMTFDGAVDMLFSSRVCSGATEDTCVYRTQLIHWLDRLGQLVNLLGSPVEASRPPTIEDVDQDQVFELVVRQDDDGDAESGPRRTGLDVYDWNGGSYVRSLTQLDPPRYRIQIVHQADAAFTAEAFDEAITLYQQVLSDGELRNWLNDDTQTLPAYAIYRLMLVYAFLEDERRIELYQFIQQNYPDMNAAPVYIQMAQAFWDALQVTNNLRSACLEVESIIAVRTEALGLLNRYGSESPTYNAHDVCPF